ncbi:PadR family transcriptional regulator [Pelagerythrobacter marensis]|uniref:PadR family transcriptional regulator n=1 Tax=Pelagerythrobacter marensis TaxID=543877 RepID=A0ABZ2D5I1_9SPHN
MTELEGTVLGLLALKPNSTAYEIRREFQKSGTAHWQASAGAIYPLLERLARKGLLTATAIGHDRRGTKHLELTDAGLTEAHGWIVGDKPGLATAAPDPIRTRCHFLALLTPAERRRILDRWIGQTEREIAKLQDAEPFEDMYEQWAVEGAVAQLAARRDWLETLSAKSAR